MDTFTIFCDMRIRSLCFLALLCSSFSFNGCFDFYYDVVQNPNGTFAVRQTIGFSNEFFQELSGVASLGDSTVTVTPNMIVDSIRHMFANKRDSLIQFQHIIGKNGITAFDVRDTTIDSMTFFSMEVTVTSVDSLPGAFHVMNKASISNGSASPSEDSDDVRLNVTRSKDLINLMFYARQKAEGFMSMDIPGIQDNFNGLKMYYRVFSPDLEKPHDKKIKQISGGQERVFGLNDLLKKGRQSHLDATFVIKNTMSNK